MPSLPNYLRTNRKRLSFSQEEVAFLLGVKGQSKGSKVSRNEQPAYVPSLQTALAYEAIYGKPVRELFAGLYERIEREITERAQVLNRRVMKKSNVQRQNAIARLTPEITN